MLSDYIDVLPHISKRIQLHLPVVALESTIISHGMPYPENKNTAIALEELAKDCGCEAATIAVINGRIKVGLNAEDLNTLATSKNVLKLSRKDIPYAITKKLHGSTTVAATMYIAHLAGISVFATGGVGGVHRYVEDTMDVSGDLTEFANTPVIVVSAGAKAILDLSKTLEYLETQGVPVYGYQTNEFPSFYFNDSGLKVEKLDTPIEVAKVYKIQLMMNMKCGILLANPVPKLHTIPKEVINPIIEQALQLAKEKGIKGKEVTPFLLGKLYELSKGTSLATNIELVKNNVKVACQVAIEISKLT
jgi:pseudouridine-5'-phosphate glycosidase